jgi:hypothetical protein
MASLAPYTLTAGVGLFIVLPVGLFTPLGVYAVITGFLLFYVAAALALYRVNHLKLLAAAGGRRFTGFAFECLACPPFAINMVRRVSLAKKVTEPLPLAAARLLDAAAWDQMRSRCMSRLDEALQLVPEDSNESRSLEAQKQRLRELVKGP